VGFVLDEDVVLEVVEIAEDDIVVERLAEVVDVLDGETDKLVEVVEMDNVVESVELPPESVVEDLDVVPEVDALPEMLVALLLVELVSDEDDAVSED